MSRYQRIRKLPRDLRADAALRSLARVWHDHRVQLAETPSFRLFKQKLQREWAIETGLIERLYVWDRGVTETLIEQGIHAALIVRHGRVAHERAEHARRLIGDQLSMVDHLFMQVRGERPLTEHFIRELHQGFTRHQRTTEALGSDGDRVEIELLRGAYKRLPNNPRTLDGSIHEYCPPELVPDEMERLLAWYAEADEEGVPPEVLAAWLHHRFTQIHPFQDGNGRVARALASLVFLRCGLFPLVVRDSDRQRYLRSLEAADRGRLEPLVELFAERQRESLLNALSLEESVRQSESAEEVFDSAIRRLKERRYRWEKQPVEKTAERLVAVARKRFDSLALTMTRELHSLACPNVGESLQAVDGPKRWHATAFDSLETDSEPRLGIEWLPQDVRFIARGAGYSADLSGHTAWACLEISTFDRIQIVAHFHGLGHRVGGLLAGVVLVRAASTESSEDRQWRRPKTAMMPMISGVFPLCYAEAPESAESRFNSWIEGCLTRAMALWRDREWPAESVRRAQ